MCNMYNENTKGEEIEKITEEIWEAIIIGILTLSEIKPYIQEAHKNIICINKILIILIIFKLLNIKD